MTNTPQHDPATALALLLELAGPALHKVIREAVREAVREEREGREQPAPSEWVDVKTGSKDVLKCNPRTLARLAQSGVIPSARVGNRLRFKRADLEAYLAGGAR